jgi:ribosomal protein S18 acetylase RimI-like enzyme
MNVEIRAVQANEETLVFSFLFLASRMLEGKEPIQKALYDPHLKKYWENWGKPGDLGTVAIDKETGMPVSCSWVRLLSKEVAMEGFVKDDIPQLATGTVDGFRGKGIGSATLESLIHHAKSQFPGICLTVRVDNPAIHLYERLLFKQVPGSEFMNRVGTKSYNMLLSFNRS